MSKYCECCEYTTNLSANLKKHLASKKHIFVFQKIKSLTVEPPKPKKSIICKYCQSSFSHRSSLSYHIRNSCKKKEDYNLENSTRHVKLDIDVQEIRKTLQETHANIQESRKIIQESRNNFQESRNERIVHDNNVDKLIELVEMKMAIPCNENYKPNRLQEPNTTVAKETTEKNVKYKKRAIPSAVKKVVWNTTIGEEIGKSRCYCCKSTDITQMSFHCGHIKPEAKGGKMIVSNLKPICQNCNSSMGTKDMDEFMKSLM